MTREEAKEYLINISYKLGSMAIEYLTEKDGEKMREAIYALEQEPCEDAVSRQAVLDGLASIAKAKAKSDAQKSLMGRVMFFTEHLPSVTPQQKVGRWIRVDKDKLKCSECEVIHFIAQYPQSANINYCPNCGANMKESKEP